MQRLGLSGSPRGPRTAKAQCAALCGPGSASRTLVLALLLQTAGRLSLPSVLPIGKSGTGLTTAQVCGLIRSLRGASWAGKEAGAGRASGFVLAVWLLPERRQPRLRVETGRAPPSGCFSCRKFRLCGLGADPGFERHTFHLSLVFTSTCRVPRRVLRALRAASRSRLPAAPWGRRSSSGAVHRAGLAIGWFVAAGVVFTQ